MLEVQVRDAMAEAKAVAAQATADYLAMADRGYDCCGFAWITTHEKGTSKLVRELKKHGFERSYGGGYQWWNPSGNHTQSILAKEVGARAAAKVLTDRLGVKFYTGSRMD